MDGDRSERRIAVRILTLTGLMGSAALLVASCEARTEGRAPPVDGMYANVTVEGRTVPMIHVKDNGATVLVDTEGKVPLLWTEQFRRLGDVPEGMFDIHKTHVEGHENFRDIQVDRKGIWVIDAKGNLTAH